MISVLDVHKNTVLALQAVENGDETEVLRLRANLETMRRYLDGLPEGSTVIMESCYAWEYIHDHAVDRKLNTFVVNTGALYSSGKPQKKNDLEDCRRILRLYKIGELPTIYAMDKKLRDVRDLLRHRNFVVQKITSFRNRTHFVADRLGLRLPTAELFGAKAVNPAELPVSRTNMVQLASNQAILKALAAEEKALEAEITSELISTEDLKLLLTINGVGFITAASILLEIGYIGRFQTMERLTAYAGLVPRLDSSDGVEGKTRTRSQCNKHLKWAAVEAARHCIQSEPSMRARYLKHLHCSEEIATKEVKGKAVVAVARHLLEVVWCMLTRKEPFRSTWNSIPKSKLQFITRKGRPYNLPDARNVLTEVAETLEKPGDLVWSPGGNWEGAWEHARASGPEDEERRPAAKAAVTPESIFL
jgi:transposase